MTTQKESLLRRVAGALLVIITLVWAAMLLANGWGDANFSKLAPRMGPSLLAFVFVVLSIGIAFPAFWWLVRASGAPSPPLPEFARLHFVSQLMRHLPGRFAGVAYQVAIARHLASASQWVGANAAYMGMALWFAAALPIVILSSVGRFPVLGAGIALATLALLPLSMFALLPCVKRIGRPEGVTRHVVDVLVAVGTTARSRSLWHALSWYLTSWVVYALGWAAFGTSISGFGAVDGLVLCAFYSLAWAVGFLAVVTPSGLGVRELAFAALAKDFPPEVIAYTAVVARLGLLGADLLLGAASLWSGRYKNV